WEFSGVGNFSGHGVSDMILRSSNTGGLEIYDISHNQLTGAAFIGNVGLEWQFSGVGNFSSVPGESDLLLRNVNTGGLEVYDIQNTQLTGAAFIGAVGLEWQVAGLAAAHWGGHIRSCVAQRQQRRIRGVRHRPQSIDRSRIVRRGRLGLADGRFRCRSPNRLHGKFGQLNLAARAGNGGVWRWWRHSRRLGYR